MYPMANPTKSDGKCQIPLVTWMGGRVTASVPPPAALAAYMYMYRSEELCNLPSYLHIGRTP